VSRALRRRYGHAMRHGVQLTDAEEVLRWSRNTRLWWARAERKAPRLLEIYRDARKGPARRAALEKLKEALK
jgi:hypothetical protein